MAENETPEDDAVAVCSECHTVMRDEQAYKSQFLAEGKPGVCKSCGGVIIVANKRDLKRTLARLDRQRGIGVDVDSMPRD